MSKAPSMPMFWDAYLADTTHLTTEEHGAYLLLLAAMWRRDGSVPDDDRDNARIVGLTKARWMKVKARLSEFLIFENDTISQKNLQKNWKKTQENIQKNRTNGSKGGRPQSSKNKDIAKANGSVSDNPNETIPEPEPKPYRESSSEDSHSARELDLGDEAALVPQKPKTRTPRKPKGGYREGCSSVEDEFERIWPHYPKKTEKASAKTAWRAARRKATFSEIAKPLAQFLRNSEGTEVRWYPTLGKWLRGKRWEDDQSHAANRPRTSDEELDALMAPQTSDQQLDNLFPNGFQPKLISGGQP